MQRISITIEDALLEQLDAYMTRSGASNRSEALRDLVRRGLVADTDPNAKTECVGVFSYTLDPTVRELGRRVPQGRHDHHDRTIAAMSVPLDHTSAVEVAVMRGKVNEISTYANRLFLERGVMHGNLALIPVKSEIEFHVHGDGEAHSHGHLRVQESF